MTFEPSAAEVDRQPDRPVFGAAPIEAAAYHRSWMPPTLDVAAAEAAEVVDVELDGISDGQWEVEIARLQALIDGLTEKLEWRATGVTRNEQRLHH